MLTAYRAMLKGDRLEWAEAAPPDVGNGGLPVVVVVLKESEPEALSRGDQMAAALTALAELGGVASITDPLVWQRELREDRPLYGRDES